MDPKKVNTGLLGNLPSDVNSTMGNVSGIAADPTVPQVVNEDSIPTPGQVGQVPISSEEPTVPEPFVAEPTLTPTEVNPMVVDTVNAPLVGAVVDEPVVAAPVINTPVVDPIAEEAPTVPMGVTSSIGIKPMDEPVVEETPLVSPVSGVTEGTTKLSS